MVYHSFFEKMVRGGLGGYGDIFQEGMGGLAKRRQQIYRGIFFEGRGGVPPQNGWVLAVRGGTQLTSSCIRCPQSGWVLAVRGGTLGWGIGLYGKLLQLGIGDF